MGWSTHEDKIVRAIKALVISSSIACATISILYILAAITPLWYFHGYVRGYYSPLDYRLYYSYNGQQIYMPHTDYTRHVSIVFVLLSLSLLILSLASASLVWRKIQAAPGLIYGVAIGLGVLYGLMYGYIYRAASLDIGRFSYLTGKLNNEVIYRTLAGTIVFEGVKIEQTIIHRLVFGNTISLALLTLALLTSCAGVILTLYVVYKPMATPKTYSWSTKIKYGSAYTMLFLLTLSTLASVFTYYPSSLTISPQQPPATLELPPYTYTCTGLSRTSRVSITYTDFETYPVTGWGSYGGVWSRADGISGAKGYVLQGVDNNGGLGGASEYYYSTSLSSYTSLWTAAKTRLFSGSGHYGIALMRSPLNRMYCAVINTTGFLVIRSYGVEEATGWRTLASASIQGYSPTSWYTIVVNYTVTTLSVSIAARVYNLEGTLVASALASSTSSRRFTPAYLGVMIDDVTAYFDEFIIATADPKSISFTGLASGIFVEIWDNLGNLVSFGKASGDTLSLSVVHDIIIGTGVDGRIVVKYPDAFTCGILTVPMADALLGGDTYKMFISLASYSLGANKTSAIISMYSSGLNTFNTTTRLLNISTQQTLYASLILYNVSTPETLNISIWIESVTRSTSISISNGMPISTATNIIPLNIGGDNCLVLSGYFTSPSQSATLNLKIELCTTPDGRGVHIYYPINLTIKS